jgi:hypothetical protein
MATLVPLGTLMPEPNPFKVEITVSKLEKCKSPGSGASGPVVGSIEHSNRRFGCVKCLEILEYLSDCCFLRRTQLHGMRELVS